MRDCDFRRSLGEAVRRGRRQRGLTQAELARRAGMDARTVLTIENCRGNPKLQALSQLVRVLELDPREIFYPSFSREEDAPCQLQLLLARCSREEAAALLPVVRAALEALEAVSSQARE